ncbi:hypothetical protein M5K25_021238 [Dendrobium thyrsiflorum]|uniref:Uncharacterized protein n=1 Tax=Dendrobium thyrsiflorum TaxID=117978 RepID=A0ABD0UBU6_DENTH
MDSRTTARHSTVYKWLECLSLELCLMAEDSYPDYDYESTYANNVQCVFSRRIDSLSISDSVLIVTRIPLQHFKKIIPREIHNVKSS